MKTKELISFEVTAKLICPFGLAYADCWFSHDAAHVMKTKDPDQRSDMHSSSISLFQHMQNADFFMKQ